jgi:hypothetical protein
MADKHTIEVHQIGNQYEAIIAGIDTKVTGATLDEALTEAQQTIVASMVEEAKRKKQKRGEGRTIA